MASSSKNSAGSTSVVVSVSYQSLLRFHDDPDVRSDLIRKIGQSFGDGETCLGIIAVTDVPDFQEMRMKLLPLSRQLARLPQPALDGITDEKSGYQVGWSHGKEKVEGDKLDLAKGSFYANPLTDDLGKSRPANVVSQNPEFFAPNVWPSTALPELEAAFKDMGQLICRVGRLLARPCDAYVKSKCPDYPDKKLETILTESMYCKARLLHYFAMEPKKEEGSPSDDFSDWCGWHNDHGSLTGLVPAVYFDEDGRQIECPDRDAGLYIRSRSGDLVHVKVNTLAFQIGETSQIHTGGILQATPHAVRGCRHGKTTRESFAVFMEPEVDGAMDLPPSKTVDDVQRTTSHLPKTVRTLASRWKEGMNFGEFSNATFQAFY